MLRKRKAVISFSFSLRPLRFEQICIEMQIPTSHIITTAEESVALDANTSKHFGIDAFTLMEVAGKSAADHIQNKVVRGAKGLFLCGKGNNGGDALVAARYLSQKGVEAGIVFVGGKDGLSPLAQKNELLLKAIAENDSTVSITFIESWQAFNQSQSFDFIIDGMLGTGLNNPLRGDILEAVHWANSQNIPRFAMDISTGLHADSGKIMGEAIHATTTFAFGTFKHGFYLNEGFNYRGEVRLCELPFPDYLKKSSTFLIDESYLEPKKNEAAAHKYAAGVVYIIAGSEGLTGAAIMAAKSAWAAGVGAVILICPKGLLSVYENNLPEIIKKAVGENEDFVFKKSHTDEVLSIIQEKNGSVLIGPGLGRDDDTVQFVNCLLREAQSPCVIDADALWAMAQHDEWNFPESSSRILTPHPGELKSIISEPLDDDQNRLKLVKQFAVEKKITILSKGFPVILTNRQGEAFISSYDSRHFSRAGYGDVLAGKIAAFKVLGCTEEEACIRALVLGEKKMDTLLNKNPEYIVEPKDII